MDFIDPLMNKILDRFRFITPHRQTSLVFTISELSNFDFFNYTRFLQKSLTMHR
jgi:hypothetical protein